MSAGRLIVLAAGGTGGHLFPAEALARELTASGYRVALVTDRRGQAFGERLGVELHRIRAGRPEGGVAHKVRAAAEIWLGVREARGLLRRLDPACVAGFGGYPSVPTMLAATRLGLPTLVHEQNALLGRANRLLAGRVRRIATSFADTRGIRAKDRAKVTLTGNPVRPAIALMRQTGYATYDPEAPFRLFVMGGSQGARILGDVVPRAIAALAPELRQRLEIAQQARAEQLDAARQIYRDAGIDADLAAFFEDVPLRMASAHLVVSRAGASSVAELAVIGRPAILVPFALAAEDHQTLNARAFAANGAGWVMDEAEFTPEALTQRLASLMAAPEELAKAAAAAAAHGRPEAARDLADLVSALARGANGDPAPVERRNAA
jgi:UDP-N-acetylglucosamine--N-acetylmuramyl-(pentapeptide) pyrophosphoryl-undecaprenol N-acetylglucosamine transferase